jgi:hypothetical protein
MMSKKINMIGKTFGKLSVISEDGYLGALLSFKCLCDCGKVATVRGTSLRSGNTTSCGCVHKKMVGNLNRRHGLNASTEYSIWQNMITRCTNANSNCFYRYGGRGISVSNEWRNFEKFYADMGKRPNGMTLDRIDNNGSYSKDNCRWATLGEQARNTRRTKLVEYNGKTQCLKDWANEVGMAYNTLRKRFVLYNWSFEKALTTPPRQYSLAR